MYVLQHADQPEIYAACQRIRGSARLSSFGKGVTKYAGLTAIGGFCRVRLLHYLVTGPNRVPPKDEEDAKRLTGGADHGGL